ncbi:hypothetical protein A3709_17085 [Halioglobus sp. HI00S01]|uniref:carotenoid oxygenase family protein n=1 Tax=Halioglobus sp. HI00S01 TaxID=1822214 RepID=UPI0007C3D26D|nr:carotenoid oxygenase family protein [Halioglobus sp. HI00S01]KZX58717.1 hypothetical protein A3709_17085 [Halioglobus sp. HI00S01]
MERREFLKGLAAMASLHALPSLALGESAPAWSVGFDGLTSDQPRLPMTVEGTIPQACFGTLYRNGPTLYERAGERYQHWFDPDGMIQAFRLGPDGASHEGRFVRTRKYEREQAEGRFLFNGAGTQVANPAPPRSNQDFNVANINIQPHNGELLALWEAGSAYRIDPETLDTRGIQAWHDELEGVPFSAHPRFDERGDMWNIGSVPFAGTPTLVLYHVNATGNMVKYRAHTLDFSGYMHDFVLTPRYLIALNSSAVHEKAPTFIQGIQWRPEIASQLLVFDREDFSLVKTIEVPASFVFHFGNAWESGNTIEFTAAAYADSRFMQQGMHRLAQLKAGPYHDDPTLVHYKLDLTSGKAHISSLETDLEFPVFDRRQPFSPQRLYGVSGGQGTLSGLPSSIVSVDPRSGSMTRYNYGEHVIVEEPQYLPSGYLVHSFLDFNKRCTGVAVLRTAAIEEGPVATMTMDRVLPLGFHGCFVSQSG